MGQVLHGCATTTEAVRRAIQNSQESLRALAKRYGINHDRVCNPPQQGPNPEQTLLINEGKSGSRSRHLCHGTTPPERPQFAAYRWASLRIKTIAHWSRRVGYWRLHICSRGWAPDRLKKLFRRCRESPQVRLSNSSPIMKCVAKSGQHSRDKRHDSLSIQSHRSGRRAEPIRALLIRSSLAQNRSPDPIVGYIFGASLLGRG
ncbi:hypothetical protein ACVIGA_005707 [Bradyrhizobium sp. USDA 3240]